MLSTIFNCHYYRYNDSPFSWKCCSYLHNCNAYSGSIGCEKLTSLPSSGEGSSPIAGLCRSPLTQEPCRVQTGERERADAQSKEAYTKWSFVWSASQCPAACVKGRFSWAFKGVSSLFKQDAALDE